MFFHGNSSHGLFHFAQDPQHQGYSPQPPQVLAPPAHSPLRRVRGDVTGPDDVTVDRVGEEVLEAQPGEFERMGNRLVRLVHLGKKSVELCT